MALALPANDFKAELVGSTAKSAFKAAGATSTTDLQMVPLDKIEPIPGFNVRIETPDYLAHIEAVAKSIVANGFYRNKPLAGYAAKADDGDKIMLTDGYSRLRAVKRANELLAAAGQPAIESLPMVLKSSASTLEDLTVALVQDNEGRPLKPFERAAVVKRLEGYGWTEEQIADKFGQSVKYIQNLKLLAGAPASIRNLVINEKVSASEAIKQLVSNPTKAADNLKTAVDSAAAKGKSKATNKDVKEATAGKSSGGSSSGPSAQQKNLDDTGMWAEKDGKVKYGHAMRAKEVGPTRMTFHRYLYAKDQEAAKAEVLPILYLENGDLWDFAKNEDGSENKDRVIFKTFVDIRIQTMLAKNWQDPPAADATQDAGTGEDTMLAALGNDSKPEGDAAPTGDSQPAAGGDEALAGL